MAPSFEPPPTLRSPHVQTLLASSFLRRRRQRPFATALNAAAQHTLIPCRDGIRLTAKLNITAADAPLAVLIHGWLGDADSAYLIDMAQVLSRSGFNVARLNLRDHGGSEHLNQGMFNSARLDEVVDAVHWLHDRHGQRGTALIGYSLGGNFALRVAARNTVPLQSCFAVCPVVDPVATMDQLDNGWMAYRWYFLRKWRNALLAKQAAFPDLYQYGSALKLNRLEPLTGYFVEHYTDFASTREYLDAYSLLNGRLAGLSIPSFILTAADDPVIPAEDFAALPKDVPLHLHMTSHGGHCGFLQNLSFETYCAGVVLGFLGQLSGTK